MGELIPISLPEELENATVTGLDVAAPDESVLLHGPPGAGKTTEGGFRVALLADALDEITPGDIVFATFRTSLASAMQSKLVDWGVFEPTALPPTDPENPYRLWATAHAVSCRTTGFLEQFNDSHERYAGMVDDDAMRAFCSEYGISFRPSKPWYETRWTTFYTLYTYCKQNLLKVGHYKLDGRHLRGSIQDDTRAWNLLQEFYNKWGYNAEFSDVVTAWESWKASHDVADYWEQLEAGIRGSLPPVEAVVIDELHDAYPLMARLFDQWIDEADTAIVMGDPDQVCNSFNGADPAVFERLPERVDKDLPTVLLPKSHRCADEHFLAAARVLSRERQPPSIETDGPGVIFRHDPVTRMEYEDEASEWNLPPAEETASPYDLWTSYGSEIMFLARTQMFCDAIGAHLDREGVIYESQADVAGNWSARLRLLRVLSEIEGYRIPKQVAVTNDADTYGGDATSTKNVENATQTHLRDEDARRFVRHVDSRYLKQGRNEALEWLYESDNDGPRISLQDLNSAVVTDDFWTVYGRGKLSIDDFVRVNEHLGFSGNRMRDTVAMRRAWERYKDTEFSSVHSLAAGMKVLTIHASKGAEADHAIVYDGITRKTADSIRSQSQAAENEARTWYVSLTRATDSLHVVRDAFAQAAESYLPEDLEHAAAAAAHEKRSLNTDDCSGGEHA